MDKEIKLDEEEVGSLMMLVLYAETNLEDFNEFLKEEGCDSMTAEDLSLLWNYLA